MKMKKTILALLSIIMLAAPVFADQKIYRQSSNEVQTLIVLSRLSGTALPEMTYPVTGENLVCLLSKIDVSKLSGHALEMYTDLRSSLENRKFLAELDGAGFDLRIPVLIGEAWNSDDFLPFKDRLPLVAPHVEVRLTDYFTLESEFDFKAKEDSYTHFEDIKVHSLYNMTTGVSENYPRTAYGSIGNGVFNLTIGRDRMSAGGAMTGNLVLSENLLFQDFAKFSVLKGPISYDFSVLAYDNPTSETAVKRYDYDEPFKAAYIHRISGVIRNRMNITLYQGLMTYGKHAFSDPRVLNPFMMIHNTFTFKNGNANNFFGIEMSAMLPFGLKLDVQGFLDQLKLNSETDDSGENAFGFLANLSISRVMGEGILSGYGEFVYNNPYVYLVETVNSELDPGRTLAEYYTIDLVSAYKYFGDTDYEQNYIGYPYGSDILIFAAGASYLWNGMKFSADALYRIKGGHGIGINEERRVNYSSAVPDEKTLAVCAGVSGKLFNAFTCRAMLSYSHSENYRHVSGETSSDIRFAVGFTVDPVSLLKK